MRALLISAAVVVLAAAACTTPPQGYSTDAGTPANDAGTVTHDDAGTLTHDDAGTLTHDDAGTVTHDDAGTVTRDDAGTVTTGLPEDPGPFATTTTTDSLDVGGGRSEGLTVIAPVGAPAGPVVVIHPGFLLDSTLYTSYAENLASHGFVAVLVAPPYAVFGGPTHVELASYLGQVLDHVVQQSAAGQPLAGIADATRIGLAGHSLGGKISMLLASSDVRALAVFGIDPVDAAGGPGGQPTPDNPSVTPELMGNIHVPMALVGETTNATCTGLFCQPCAPEADNYAQYYDNATSPALEVTVAGANHVSFLDNPSCGFTCSACGAGSDDTTVTRRITRRAMTAFFQRELLQDTSAEAFLTGAPMQTDQTAGLVTETTKNGF